MSTKLREIKGIKYIEVENFNRGNMKHVFSSRIGWRQDDIFQTMAELLNLNKNNIYRCRQVHGNRVLVIDQEDASDVLDIEADGLVTNRRNILLSTYHADCTPIYFHDEIKDVIAVAHAGWRGSLLNIVSKVLSIMESRYNSNIKDINVAIGPAICGVCYEVKEDVSSKFREVYGDSSGVLSYKNERIYLDTVKVNEINLLNYGILEENIYKSNLCTGCNLDILYSYRKENKTRNRMISGIILN